MTDKSDKHNKEYVIAGPPLSNGNNVAIYHHSDHSVSFGEIGVPADGKSLSDDTILVQNRQGTPFYDVVGSVGEMKHSSTDECSKSGPAMVTSDKYRAGWDQIFGKKQNVGLA